MAFRKSSPENEADVERIAGVLRELSIGDTSSYTDLCKSVGYDVRRRRWLIDRARKRVEGETGAIFEVVRDVGIKRLRSEDIPSVGLAALRKVRRTSKRGAERLGQVRVNDLDPKTANKVIAHKSQLGAIALVADGRKSTVVASEVKRSGGAVSVGRVLELFKSE